MASEGSSASSPMPSETVTLPPGNEQQAVDRFNVSAALGEDFVPKDAAEAALAVAANNIRRFAAPARKKFPYLPVEERPDRPSIEEYASQQYTPEIIQQKKEAGRWTASDQLRVDEVIANNASVDLKRRRYELARKVDAQGAVLPEDEAAMQRIESERAAAMSQYEQALKNFSGSGE